MNSLNISLYICSILCCFGQLVLARTFDFDDEGLEDTRLRISEIIGAEQLTLRSYLSGVKLERQTLEHDVRINIGNAKKSFDEDLKKVIEELDQNTKTAIDSEQKSCIDSMTQEISKLKTASDTLKANCTSVAKPNVQELDQEQTQFAEYQMKIGQLPQPCVQTYEDTNAIIACVKKATEALKKEMKSDEEKIAEKLKLVKKDADQVGIVLNECISKQIEVVKTKANGIKQNFDNCIEM